MVSAQGCLLEKIIEEIINPVKMTMPNWSTIIQENILHMAYQVPTGHMPINQLNLIEWGSCLYIRKFQNIFLKNIYFIWREKMWLNYG